MSDIPKHLSIKRHPVQNNNNGGLKIFGAGRRSMRLFKPLRPIRKSGHGHKRRKRDEDLEC